METELQTRAKSWARSVRRGRTPEQIAEVVAMREAGAVEFERRAQALRGAARRIALADANVSRTYAQALAKFL